MKLTRIGVPGDLDTQVRVLAPGTSGTLQIAVRSSPAATFTDVASVGLGPGLTASLGAGWVFGEGVRLAPEVAVGRRFRAVGRIEAPLDSLGASRVVVEGRWTF